MLRNILRNASIMPADTVESVYLSEVDYSKPRAYFLIVFRYNDGSTTAAYIEKGNTEELQKFHATLAIHLMVGKWVDVERIQSTVSMCLN